MPEYFEISLIIDKKHVATVRNHLATTFGLHEGANNVEKSQYSVLNKREVLVSLNSYEENDYAEWCISIPDLLFHKISFQIDLNQLTVFVQACFKGCKGILLALCSYEINSYLLSHVHTVHVMDSLFLLKFPVTYVQQEDGIPLITVNMQAQDIMVSE